MESLNLLIIEDEEDIRLLYKCIVQKKFALNILEAETLQACKEAIKKAVPDIVILDLCLPDGKGCDLIPDLKACNPNVKIMVVTAFQRCEETKKSSALGVDYILKKPFNKDTFVQHLGKLVNKV